jgi:biotin carboxylase
MKKTNTVHQKQKSSSSKSQKNILLFVGGINSTTITIIRKFEKQHKQKFRIAVLVDSKHKLGKIKDTSPDALNIFLDCDITSNIALQKTLAPIERELLAVTCRGDNHIPMMAKVIPHVPYLKTPTAESLQWAIDKVWMRRRLFLFDKKITPSYTLVSGTTAKSLKKIETKVGFPLVVKPSGLGASRLVSIVYHKKELHDVLKKIFRKINSVYKINGYHGEKKVLVEQFMEGEMYSIDAYVTGRGKVYFCPLVSVKTGRTIGFDDFFGYSQMTPTNLKKTSVSAAEKVATASVHALGLRSTSVHIELMRTEKGWKIIELGPRIGGFRHTLYEMSFGINHTMNDILIRIPQKPSLPTKVLAHSVAMKFFAKKEGRLKCLLGVKKAKTLQSFKKISLHKKIGDHCTFAKHGGSSVFDIILSNKERSKLLADVRRLEQMVKIETE